MNPILYTWSDIYDTLRDNELPAALTWYRVYVDGLQIGLRDIDKKAEIEQWLKELFSDLYQESQIRLDTGESLPVMIQELDDFEDSDFAPRPFVPSFERPSYILNVEQRPLPDSSKYPTVVAFHSFKGGVGRTLHSILFALSYQRMYKASSILLVDGDFEAPGISYLYRDSFPNDGPTHISYADVLTLAHGDSDPSGEKTIRFTVNKLKGQMIDFERKIYVLPAFRTISQLESLPIKPEQLYKDSNTPLYPSDLLARIGAALKVDLVIVDLRAGMSELASGILVDPRVLRVFVTTFSSQSRRGTLNLLEILQRYVPDIDDNKDNKASEFTPVAIINQVPISQVLQYSQISEELDNFEQSLKEKLRLVSSFPNAGVPSCIRTGFKEQIFILPGKWNELVSVVEKELSETIDGLKELVRGLPVLSNKPTPPYTRREEQVHQLAEEAKAYGEFAKDRDFLVTQSLKNLATAFRQSTPNAVVIGAKGSGKTYTAKQIVARKTWQEFVQKCLPPARIQQGYLSLFQEDYPSWSIGSETLTIPILQPINGEKIPKEFSWGKIQAEQSEVKKWLEFKGEESDWIARWLDFIAWQAGYEVGTVGAGNSFIKMLESSGKKFVGIIDGIEDYFQEIATNEYQQRGLRVLLQEIPRRLKNTPLGILIFVREDMIRLAIKYNVGQFIEEYKNYHLAWNRTEALRLAVWVARKVLDGLEETPVESLSDDGLEHTAVKLWGRKLGKDASRQAHSTGWVIDVLSTLNNQIQARDIVRLIQFAAENTIKSTAAYLDRLLDPKAIRDAVKACSDGKIEDLEQEIPKLKTVFDKLRSSIPQAERRSPIEKQKLLTYISNEDLDFLKQNGIVRENENGTISIAEIFRQGLGFERGRPGKSRVRNR
jgi:MinD-like ATPase involved in chromosome partitioning or flagellar assembly